LVVVVGGWENGGWRGWGCLIGTFMSCFWSIVLLVWGRWCVLFFYLEEVADLDVDPRAPLELPKTKQEI
jgi:hypothetical protein